MAVNEMGLHLMDFPLSTFLKICVIFTKSQSFNKTLDDIDWVSVICGIGAISMAQHLRILDGILSGPGDLSLSTVVLNSRNRQGNVWLP